MKTGIDRTNQRRRLFDNSVDERPAPAYSDQSNVRSTNQIITILPLCHERIAILIPPLAAKTGRSPVAVLPSPTDLAQRSSLRISGRECPAGHNRSETKAPVASAAANAFTTASFPTVPFLYRTSIPKSVSPISPERAEKRGSTFSQADRQARRSCPYFFPFSALSATFPFSIMNVFRNFSVACWHLKHYPQCRY